MRCVICDSAKTDLLREHRYAGVDFVYRYHRCVSCTAQFVWPQPDRSLLASLYHEAYYGHAVASASPADINSYAERLDSLEELIGGVGSLLDIGAGSGLFLREARRRGWMGIGVEISKPALEHARSAGLTMIEGFFESLDLPVGSFDAIHAWAVFEHLTDPQTLVRRARELLRPEGVLVLHTVNSGSLNARYYGPDWEYFQDPGHLCFPTPGALRRLFTRYDLKVVKQRVGGNPIGINRLSALNNARGVRHAGLKHALLGVQRYALSNAVLRKTLKRAIHALKMGDVITFYVRPSPPREDRSG